MTDSAFPLIFLSLGFSAMLLSLLSSLLAQRGAPTAHVRYDYKVVDLIILQDPDNHERQIQKWADEGWKIVGLVPLIGGAAEGAPEVRYVLKRPWGAKRLALKVKAEAKQLRQEQREQRLLQRQGEKALEDNSTKKAQPNLTPEPAWVKLKETKETPV